MKKLYWKLFGRTIRRREMAREILTANAMSEYQMMLLMSNQTMRLRRM